MGGHYTGSGGVCHAEIGRGKGGTGAARQDGDGGEGEKKTPRPGEGGAAGEGGGRAQTSILRFQLWVSGSSPYWMPWTAW